MQAIFAQFYSNKFPGSQPQKRVFPDVSIKKPKTIKKIMIGWCGGCGVSRPTSHCKSGSALRVFLFQHKMLFESIPHYKKNKNPKRFCKEVSTHSKKKRTVTVGNAFAVWSSQVLQRCNRALYGKNLSLFSIQLLSLSKEIVDKLAKMRTTTAYKSSFEAF